MHVPLLHARIRSMNPRVRSWLTALVIGLVCAGLAGLLRIALTPLWGGRFVFTFSFPAVIVAAWYGRLVAGMTATITLGIVSTWFLPPAGELFALTDMADALAISTFVVFGCV